MLFDKQQSSVIISELTPEVAQIIYEGFKEGKSHTDLFREGYPFEHSQDVRNEIQSLQKLAHDAMMRIAGSYEKEVGIDEETGATVYETVTTDPSPVNETELQGELDSDILDIPIFVKDFIDYVLKYKEGTTWEEFEEQFNFLKTQNEI